MGSVFFGAGEQGLDIASQRFGFGHSGVDLLMQDERRSHI
jgi:hypothetical protein